MFILKNALNKGEITNKRILLKYQNIYNLYEILYKNYINIKNDLKIKNKNYNKYQKKIIENKINKNNELINKKDVAQIISNRNLNLIHEIKNLQKENEFLYNELNNNI